MTINEVLEQFNENTPIEVWDAKTWEDVQLNGWQVAPGYWPWKGTIAEFIEGDDTDPEEGCLYKMMCEDEAIVEDYYLRKNGTVCILYSWY